MTPNRDEFDQLIEDAELDQLLEQEMREEVCGERGHDYGIIVACKRCGDAVHVCGVSDEAPDA